MDELINVQRKRKAFIIEEFTRFGGGQTVFGEVYSVLREIFTDVKVVTDKVHTYIPKQIPSNDIITTKLSNTNWDSPLKLLPKIYFLKRELRALPGDEFSFNNHPNVFIYNATVNFGHELFGFLNQNQKESNKLKILAIRKAGIFRTYVGAYFLTNGSYTERILKDTFSKLGISNIKIEKIDLPTFQPENLELRKKEDIVLTFGRISKDKNLEMILDLCSQMPRIRFIISGRAVKMDQPYLQYLIDNRPKNLTILANPDKLKKDQLFRKARVYLHTKKFENYGISVAEAVSYGCFPIVPSEGGAYDDILMGGRIGRGYSNISEIKELIYEGINSSVEELHNILQTRGRFSPVEFKLKLRNIIEDKI